MVQTVHVNLRGLRHNFTPYQLNGYTDWCTGAGCGAASVAVTKPKKRKIQKIERRSTQPTKVNPLGRSLVNRGGK